MPPCVLYFMYVRRQCQVMSVGRVFETGTSREEFTHNFRISCFTLNTTCSSGHRARNLQELLRKGVGIQSTMNLYSVSSEVCYDSNDYNVVD